MALQTLLGPDLPQKRRLNLFYPQFVTIPLLLGPLMPPSGRSISIFFLVLLVVLLFGISH